MSSRKHSMSLSGYGSCPKHDTVSLESPVSEDSKLYLSQQCVIVNSGGLGVTSQGSLTDASLSSDISPYLAPEAECTDFNNDNLGGVNVIGVDSQTLSVSLHKVDSDPEPPDLTLISFTGDDRSPENIDEGFQPFHSKTSLDSDCSPVVSLLDADIKPTSVIAKQGSKGFGEAETPTAIKGDVTESFPQEYQLSSVPNQNNDRGFTENNSTFQDDSGEIQSDNRSKVSGDFPLNFDFFGREDVDDMAKLEQFRTGVSAEVGEETCKLGNEIAALIGGATTDCSNENECVIFSGPTIVTGDTDDNWPSIQAIHTEHLITTEQHLDSTSSGISIVPPSCSGSVTKLKLFTGLVECYSSFITATDNQTRPLAESLVQEVKRKQEAEVKQLSPGPAHRQKDDNIVMIDLFGRRSVENAEAHQYQWAESSNRWCQLNIDGPQEDINANDCSVGNESRANTGWPGGVQPSNSSTGCFPAYSGARVRRANCFQQRLAPRPPLAW